MTPRYGWPRGAGRGSPRLVAVAPGGPVAEVVDPRPIHEVGREREHPVLVAADVAAPFDQVARVAGPYLAALGPIALQQPVEHAGIGSEPAPGHVLTEDACVRLGPWRLHGQAVPQPAQEGLLGQVSGSEIAGEDQELLEGDLDLLAGVQRQVVDPILEGDDPAVEEVARLNPLTSEIVDQQ